MAKVITIAIQKGGVGKTTVAQAVGVGLFHRGYKVLFIDLDMQGNLSYALGVDSRAIQAGSDSLIMRSSKKQGIKPEIIHTAQGDIIPAGPGLKDADIKLATVTRKQYQLRESIKAIKPDYDYIIIDTPMQIGILTINALTASDRVIIPAKADMFSLQGLGQEYPMIREVQEKYNPDLQIAGILANCYNARSIFKREINQYLIDTAQGMKTRVFDTRIRESVAISEAQGQRVDFYEYAPKCNAVKDFNALVDELLKGDI